MRRIFSVALSIILIFGLASTSVNASGTAARKVTIYFGADSARLDKQDKAKLFASLDELQSATNITITGYIRNAPGPKTERGLDRKRAVAVRKYLQNHGVSSALLLKSGGYPKSQQSNWAARKVVITYVPAVTQPAVPGHTLTFESTTMASPNTVNCLSDYQNSRAYSAKITYGTTTRTALFNAVSSNSSNTYMTWDTTNFRCKYVATFTNVPAGPYTYELTAYSDAKDWFDTTMYAQGEFSFTKDLQTYTAGATADTWDGITMYGMGTGQCQYRFYQQLNQTEIVGVWTGLTMPNQNSIGPKTALSGGCD